MNNKLIMSIMGITIGVILVGSVLAPVIQDAQKVTGSPETYSNVGAYTDVAYYSEELTDVTVSLSGGVWTINGAIVSTPRGFVFACDWLFIQSNVTSWYANWVSEDQWGVRNITAATISIEDSVCSASVTYDNGITQTRTDDVHYVLYRDDSGKMLGLDIRNVQPYILDTNNIVLTGQYYTGENDTMYSAYGSATWTAEDYTSSVTYTTEAVEGTTDVYRLTGIEFTVGDESFSPYTILVPKEVVGHLESGGSYSLLGVIPLIVIAGLLVSAIAMVRPRD